jgi:hypothetical protein
MPGFPLAQPSLGTMTDEAQFKYPPLSPVSQERVLSCVLRWPASQKKTEKTFICPGQSSGEREAPKLNFPEAPDDSKVEIGARICLTSNRNPIPYSSQVSQNLLLNLHWTAPSPGAIAKV